MIPLYQEPKNSPFVPNIQKQIYEQEKPKFEKSIEQGKPKFEKPDQEKPAGKFFPPYAGKQPLQPIVDLQVYNPRPPPKKKPEINSTGYPSP